MKTKRRKRSDAKDCCRRPGVHKIGDTALDSPSDAERARQQRMKREGQDERYLPMVFVTAAKAFVALGQPA